MALSLTARAEGTSGVLALLRKLVQADVGARWYLFAVGYMPGATNSFTFNASIVGWMTVAVFWMFAGFFLVSMRKSQVQEAVGSALPAEA